MDFALGARTGGEGRVMAPGSLVIVFLHHDDLSFVYLKPHEILNNKWGSFHHDDVLGKEFGVTWHSRAAPHGWVYALSPTPELWARALPHRTQIVHELDASMVVFMLGLKPGHVVCESGTGSGAMSTTIMRSIAPSGHLHTFEFNESRVDAATAEFRQNGVGHLCTVRHRDVCGKGAPQLGTGFDPVAPSSVDGVFLDLPEPWLAVDHARKVLRPSRKVCSYSPCIEQAMKTCKALREGGFHSVKTVEARLKSYDVSKVILGRPDFGHGGLGGSGDAGGDADEADEAASPPKRARGEDVAAPGKDGECGGEDASLSSSSSSSSSASSAEAAAGCSSGKAAKEERLVARPLTTMRGHTAFLTFATRSAAPWVPPTEAEGGGGGGAEGGGGGGGGDRSGPADAAAEAN